MKGKVSPEILEQLKEEYGSPLFVYPLPNGKHDFVFKPVSHELHARIRQMENDAKEKGLELSKHEVSNMVFDSCVVWPVLMPEEVDSLPVGLMSTLPKIIEEKSGFTEVDIRGNILGPNISVIPVTEPSTWPDYTAAELEEVKNETQFQVLHVRLDKWLFLIRPMTRSDMLVAQTAADNVLSLAKCVCLWPKEVPWATIPAGYIDQIGNIALNVSGWRTDTLDIVEV